MSYLFFSFFYFTDFLCITYFLLLYYNYSYTLLIFIILFEFIEDRQVVNMELEEYAFIYEDLKAQIKQLPHLQQLLRLTQKSTRKLQCINLYSISDKRDFDLQLQQQQITAQIRKLYIKIVSLQQKSSQSSSEIEVQSLSSEISQIIEDIKQKNMEIFDLLNKQDQLLTLDIQAVGYSVEEDHQGNFIKEEDQFDEDNMKDSNNGNGELGGDRVAGLKKEIQQISAKIAKINGGRGKWYQTDHQDFIKIYNKCGGNGKKIIDEGVKILGMKNTQIMDHLQLYQNYLQLQKQKKIISEQYKQIKLFEKIEEDEKKERQRKQAQERKKLKKQKQIQENQKKREMLQKYKQRKNEQKVKMIEQQQKKQKQKILKIPIPAAKKKQIIERNQKYITEKQNNFRKNSEKIQQKQKVLMQPGIMKIEKSREKIGSRSKLRTDSQLKMKKQGEGSVKKI